MKPAKGPGLFQRPSSWWLWQRTPDGKRRISPLTLRILVVNSLALFILFGGVLYMSGYEQKLVSSELELLQTEARLYAGALGEGAVIINLDENQVLSPELARQMVRSLVEVSDNRTRLFDANGNLVADSRVLAAGGRRIEIGKLEEIATRGSLWSQTFKKMSRAVGRVLGMRSNYPALDFGEQEHTAAYGSIMRAQRGEEAGDVWLRHNGQLLLTAAAPIARYKQVLGVIFLSKSSSKIDQALADVRFDVVRIFIATLAITILLSLYLARTIAQPIKLLAEAVEGVRAEQANQTALGGAARILLQKPIPEFPGRHDEIGELSSALKAMTQALAERIGAIENFAADVAHEIKNPLTSLRSAVETAERVTDMTLHKRLMNVIRDDVTRLDRLISDISAASRLEAELSRAAMASIDINAMLTTLADIYAHHENKNHAAVIVSTPPAPMKIMGLEGRLMQVFTNLVDNALSFSPPGGRVRLTATRNGNQALVTIDDDGMGLPENKLNDIFNRFYSERPKGEKFGMHSGLGLSIAKQIVEAHRGRIWAENRLDAGQKICGARFSVQLPVIL